jgi:hypothetical protein
MFVMAVGLLGRGFLSCSPQVLSVGERRVVEIDTVHFGQLCT